MGATDARERKHLSQAEAAERVNVGLGTYQRWERGERRPQPHDWRRLSSVFGSLLDDAGETHHEGRDTNAVLPDDQVRTDSGSQAAIALLQEQNSSRHDASSSSTLAISSYPIAPLISDSAEEMILIVSPEIPQAQIAFEMTLLDALWTPAFLDHLTSSEKRSAIRQVIQEFDAMNTTNQNYRMTRRDAVRALARLPMITLGLTIPGSIVQPARYGDAIAHCGAALEGCWELWRSSDGSNTLLAFQCVSKYLPILKTIAKDSATYRDQALDLASQYADLQAQLGRVCVGLTESTWYAKEAVFLSGSTRHVEISTRLSTYVSLAWSYFYDGKFKLAWTTMQEGEAVLKEYQQTPGKPPIQAGSIGGFYSVYAVVQTKNGESPDMALGIAANNVGVGFRPSTQMREAALVYCYKGDYTQAIQWIGKRINTDTIEDARTSKHELGFNQAIANFEAMEVAWPEDPRVQELRPLMVHW